MKNTVLRICLTMAVLFWMGLIFWFSAQEAEISTDMSRTVGYRVGEFFISDFGEWSGAEQQAFAARIDFPVRKGAHASEYAFLGLLLTGTAAAYRVPGRWRRYAFAFLVTAAYAVSDEFHQLFVPGRSGQVSDVLLDSVGALVGVFFFFLAEKILSFHAKNV